MVRRDGAYVKTERIAEIRRVIARSGPVNRGELVAYIEATIGLAENTVRKYLDILVASKQVSYDETEDTYAEVKPGG